MAPTQNRFATFAWLTLGYNVLVILWGALVRATGSGAGCGANWPSCRGEVIPLGSALETWIEFAHRASSGVALVLVVALAVWAFRVFNRGHLARRAAVWSLAFIVIEALVGAGLVLFELVAENSSVARAVIIALHLANTLMLLAALTLSAWSAQVNVARKTVPGSTIRLLTLSGASLMLLAMSGAVTALGDTLFPMAEIERLGETIQSHFLVQMRAWHPLLAVSLGTVAAGIAYRLGRAGASRRPARVLIGLYVAQLVAGLLNIGLSAPLWMQIVHLLLADAVWIAFVLLAATLVFKADSTTAPPPQTARGGTG